MEEEKKFDLVEIVLLIIIALFNDLLLVGADLSVAIPVVGQVLGGGMELINVLIWGLILLWFIMKMGFAAEIGLIQVAGGVAEFFGVPGRTATVAIGIYMANHPKVAALATEVAATVVATTATAGAAATAGKAAGAAGAEAGAAEGAAAAPRITDIKAPPTEAPQAPPKEKPPEEAFGVKKELEKPAEALEERLLKSFPQPEKEEKEGESSEEGEEEPS